MRILDYNKFDHFKAFQLIQYYPKLYNKKK